MADCFLLQSYPIGWEVRAGVHTPRSVAPILDLCRNYLAADGIHVDVDTLLRPKVTSIHE
jgi:hypothetical protein